MTTNKSIPDSQMKFYKDKLFVGGLSFKTSDDSLRDYFSKYGPIKQAVVMKDTERNVSRGFGFCIFKNSNDAVAAMDVKEHIIDDRKVDVRWALPKEMAPPPISNEQQMKQVYRKLFIGGISQNTTQADFQQYFSQFGPIESCNIVIDSETKKNRGFGFVIFASFDVANFVLNQPFHIINGKNVEVKRAFGQKDTEKNSANNEYTPLNMNLPSYTQYDYYNTSQIDPYNPDYSSNAHRNPYNNTMNTMNSNTMNNNPYNTSQRYINNYHFQEQSPYNYSKSLSQEPNYRGDPHHSLNDPYIYSNSSLDHSLYSEDSYNQSEDSYISPLNIRDPYRQRPNYTSPSFYSSSTIPSHINHLSPYSENDSFMSPHPIDTLYISPKPNLYTTSPILNIDHNNRGNNKNHYTSMSSEPLYANNSLSPPISYDMVSPDIRSQRLTEPVLLSKPMTLPLSSNTLTNLNKTLDNNDISATIPSSLSPLPIPSSIAINDSINNNSNNNNNNSNVTNNNNVTTTTTNNNNIQPMDIQLSSLSPIPTTSNNTITNNNNNTITNTTSTSSYFYDSLTNTKVKHKSVDKNSFQSAPGLLPSFQYNNIFDTSLDSMDVFESNCEQNLSTIFSDSSCSGLDSNNDTDNGSLSLFNSLNGYTERHSFNVPLRSLPTIVKPGNYDIDNNIPETIEEEHIQLSEEIPKISKRRHKSHAIFASQPGFSSSADFSDIFS
ncbi:hypothetical protein WA158_007448 [Blastocystis sp. Blastoise]